MCPLIIQLANGKKVDGVAESDDRKIAIEIETVNSDAIYNIRKDLESVFDEIESIFLTKDIKHKILLHLKELGLYEEEKIKLLDIYQLQHLMNKDINIHLESMC